MSALSQDVANRRKMWPKVIVFLALVATIWLQPKVQTWLDGRGTSRTEISDVVDRQNSSPSASTQLPAERRRVIIKDADEPPLAGIDRSEAAAAKMASPKPSVRKRPFESPGSDPPGAGRRDSGADPVRTDTPLSEAQPQSESAPGKLREIRNNVFESTAGLRYVSGSTDSHRLRHVMQHARDDMSKPIHGVFEGDRDQILAVIDEAWQKAKSGGRDVRRKKQNDRFVYTVSLGRKIGYMGGFEGERKGNPDCRYLRIVLEDENIVISAYPTLSF